MRRESSQLMSPSLHVFGLLFLAVFVRSQPSSNVIEDLRQQRVLRLVSAGDVDGISTLLAENEDMNFTRHGVSPLLLAARYNRTQMVSLLLRNGVDPDPIDPGRAAPLWIASFKGFFEIANLLLEHGANVDAANNRGVTSIYVGSQEGHFRVVRALINQGADLNYATNAGATPLLIAAQGGHSRIVRILLSNGADVNAQTIERRQCALWIASLLDFEDIVALLCATSEINPDLQSSDGTTALHQTAQRGHTTLMRVLVIQAGADVNLEDNRGRTAMHLACLNENLDQFYFLLEHGGDVDLQTRYGRTPRSIIDHAESAEFRIRALELLNEGEQESNSISEQGRYSLESEEDSKAVIVVPVIGLVVLLLLVLAVFWTQRRFRHATENKEAKIVRDMSSTRLPLDMNGPGSDNHGASSQASYLTPVAIPHALSPEVLRTFTKSTSAATVSHPNSISVEDKSTPPQEQADPASTKVSYLHITYSTLLKETPTAMWLALQGKNPTHKMTRTLPQKTAITAGPSVERRVPQQEVNVLHCPVVDPRHGVGNFGLEQQPHPSPRIRDQTLNTSEEGCVLTRASSGPYSFLEEWLKTKSSEGV